ncbi:MAG: RNA 2',3'-cyclic phosphodiesterase [Candidatus Omnitrophica bacterium]|nr:RNA 2',3'-cyclic phosphodiesterase [Candidatus Omnitrophota bacterium]
MRLFIAIELPDEIKKNISSLQQELKKANADVKWVDPLNVHFTLKFLGDVPESKIPDLKSVLDRTAQSYSKFKSNLFKLGAFPKLDYPRVIWLGLADNCSVIEEMASKIGEGCEALGFSREKRSFSAHLTLGRVRSGKNKELLKKILISTEVTPQSFVIDKVTLFQSKLTPKGSIYTALYSAGLK